MATDLTDFERLPLFGPEMRRDPFAVYRRLREADPVYWSEQHNAWFVTGYDAVAAGLEDLRLSSNRVDTLEAAVNTTELRPFFDFLRDRLVLTDPPKHTRIRGLLNKSFTPHNLEAMRPPVQRLVDEFLDAVQGAGRMDVIHDLAFPLPATVITKLLGVPPEDKDKLKAWSDAFVAYFSNHPSQITTEQYRAATEAMNQFVGYFTAAIENVRQRPTECLLRVLELAEDEGHKLTEQEVMSNASLLLVAGHETTTGVIGNGMYELLRNPDQMDALRQAPELIPGAVEEFLRYGGPVQFTNRMATEDVELGGKTIRKGQFVFLFLAAANRDPAHFPDPERFDITRPVRKHLAFGMGHHFCLGAPLARMEIQIAFATLLKRFAEITLEPQEIERNENFNMWGLKRLMVALRTA